MAASERSARSCPRGPRRQLNPRELLAVASLLQTARRALLYDAEHETKTTLTPVFGLLSGNRDLEESITTAIISEEEIADGISRAAEHPP
ncbi:MAG: hypothetical protein ACLT4C_01925 [Butyricicoccus sp.]